LLLKDTVGGLGYARMMRRRITVAHNDQISTRVRIILEILTAILKSKSKSIESVRAIRIKEVGRIAERENTTRATVSDKFRRELGAGGTDAFDLMVMDWLTGRSNDLRDRLLDSVGFRSYAVADADKRVIKKFFSEGNR
jgi:hypothetical protein